MLTITCQESFPKFSPFISTSAAAASRPTTPGRSPLNTAATEGCFWYFKKNRLMRSIRIKEGKITARVANYGSCDTDQM